jgi:phenylacetate-CoA ligase
MALGDQDFRPLDQIEATQEAHWQRQRDYVARRSVFYQRLWNPVQPPEKLADLPILPLTSKQMFRDSQERSPPYGDYLAAPLEKINRILKLALHSVRGGGQSQAFREA